MLRLLYFIIPFILLTTGCSQRKDFVPAHISGTITFNHFLKSPLETTSRTSAVLKNGDVFSLDGQTLLKLKNHARFINETDTYYIVSNDCRSVEIINKQTQESKTFPLSTCIVAGNIKDNFLAFVLRDNTYGILDMSSGETKMTERGVQIIAVDSLIAQPIFLDTTVVFPTLDGQISIVSLKTFKVERIVIVNSEQFFSNVIYLAKAQDTLVAATIKKVISLAGGHQYEYAASIRDIKVHNNSIYVLTLDGRIVQLDLTMRVLNEVQLPYALFSGIVITDNKLFTLERLGYLIVLDLQSFQYRVYTLRNILGKILNNKILFYDNQRVYYDKYYLDFSKDWQK